MEVVKVTQENNKIVILLKAGEQAYPHCKQATESNLNQIVFNGKEEALKCFLDIIQNNTEIIEKNEKSLSQMDTDSFEKINDFAEAIKKADALSKNKSVKIEGLIKAHENYKGLVRNVEQGKEHNEFLAKIVEGIKGVK